MVMEDLDKMLKDATTATPDVADEIQGLEETESFQLKPTAVQVSRNSRPVTIYHTQTGEPRTLPYLYAETALYKRFRPKDGRELAGKRVFTSKNPGIWVLGTVKCLLHPDRPNRKLYDSWGLPTCKSEHFPSEFEAERHLSGDHSAAANRIEEIKEKEERDEDRRLQTQGISNQNKILAQLAGGASEAVNRPRANGKTFPCAHGCGKRIKSQNGHDRNSHSEK